MGADPQQLADPVERGVQHPAEAHPVKKDTQKDPTISIDGKTALLGDEIYYRVTLDARQDNQAYKVWRLGMTDDYDDEYLKLDATNVEITDETGKDVTDKFNIQDKDGVLYAYAKLVDTEFPRRARPSRATHSRKTARPTASPTSMTRSPGPPSTRRSSATRTP